MIPSNIKFDPADSLFQRALKAFAWYMGAKALRYAMRAVNINPKAAHFVLLYTIYTYLRDRRNAKKALRQAEALDPEVKSYENPMDYVITYHQNGLTDKEVENLTALNFTVRGMQDQRKVANRRMERSDEELFRELRLLENSRRQIQN